MRPHSIPTHRRSTSMRTPQPLYYHTFTVLFSANHNGETDESGIRFFKLSGGSSSPTARRKGEWVRVGGVSTRTA